MMRMRLSEGSAPSATSSEKAPNHLSGVIVKMADERHGVDGLKRDVVHLFVIVPVRYLDNLVDPSADLFEIFDKGCGYRQDQVRILEYSALVEEEPPAVYRQEPRPLRHLVAHVGDPVKRRFSVQPVCDPVRREMTV